MTYGGGMMEELLVLARDPNAWAALATLIVMEVVLGIDNLIFISILTNKLPEEKRSRTRRIGIGLAVFLRLGLLGSVAFIVQLTSPLFSLFGHGFSWRDLILIGGGLFFFKPWTKMNIPFLSSMSGKKETVENADKVKDIALRNVRQYYIPNEKAGNIFVVEGKAVNNFATPKERIKVEISLFDEKGHVLVNKQILCGNTLSQFQLQVQSEEEINASLASEVGILTSNTYLKTGMDTPFMAVFFKPPDAVKEFGVKVIDVLDPK